MSNTYILDTKSTLEFNKKFITCFSVTSDVTKIINNYRTTIFINFTLSCYNFFVFVVLFLFDSLLYIF